ncbi:zinc ribbon domain-containing protein [Nocardioides sp. QY071]|uniref:FmdB family zinc ribbon protein n=1 Tax=Nocardioides sp. QY071 TaxID=3044187 RepID=UPI00249BC17B|nr:FmdB family zinc ribbon protein [Nocardioides sp. QY071]WGY02902.1 zinc ribbon domain-containing protein [Nocardioides sp. QY071]
MPTYQYLCTECGHAFEQVQKFSDDALTTCPECTGKLRKVFNSVGVVFKGSGFYKTDSKASSSASSTPSTPAASSTTSSSSSSESSGASSTSSAASPA